jgi:phosphoribosylformylglycinamidine cyclo-ligase
MLLSTTDGVGTKILVARKLGVYDTIGIDLVAMSVNDLIVCGAEPLVFLDYIACNSLDEKILHDVIAGVVRGCEQASCTLAGGETAEMPDLYASGDFDLAGFCTGIVEKSAMLPKTAEISAGDTILGIPSVGIHSNGLSLARKVIPENDLDGWKEMLVPTRIYVSDMKPLLSTGHVLAAAHITGGGLLGNFRRVLPETVNARFSWDWEVPHIFGRIARDGEIATEEMRAVFNMGIGIAMVAHEQNADELIRLAGQSGTTLLRIGAIVDG